MPSINRPEILVLGGGFGGLETVFYLRWRLGERADLTLVSDRDRFLFKRNTIYIPFGLDPEKLTIPLAQPTRRKGVAFVQAWAREIDPAAHLVATETGRLPYDYLVVATGAAMRPAEIPGLAEHAETIWNLHRTPGCPRTSAASSRPSRRPDRSSASRRSTRSATRATSR